MTHRQSPEAGMTLIEIVIAITLLSLLSVGMLVAMRVGLNSMSKVNNNITNNRRALGVEKILTQQIAGFMPVEARCIAPPEAPRQRVPFFQGDRRTMRFVSTYSLQEAARGYPQILEFQVIPAEDGRGVRLIVNEHLYTGPLGTGNFCTGRGQDPATGGVRTQWIPVIPGPNSFVLMDKLASCDFAYREERPNPLEPDIWRPDWIRDEMPAAVRIEMRLLEPDASRIQMPLVVAPFRPTRRALDEVKEE